MSDAAIANVVTGLVTICTIVVGFLTMWMKLRYGITKAEAAATEAATKAKAVEKKIDHNTVITEAAAEAASKASEHALTCDEEKLKLLRGLESHENRIVALEGQITSLKVLVDGVSRNIDSTRHEMRGQLQTLVNKLDLMATAPKRDA